MLYLIFSCIGLGITIMIRKIQKNTSIVTYLIWAWLIANLIELLNMVITKQSNMGFYGFMANMMIAVCGAITSSRKTTYTHEQFSISKLLFSSIFILFVLSSVQMAANFITIIVSSHFNFVQLLLQKDSLMPSGVFAYFFLFGISCILFIPYTQFPRKYKILIVLFILLMYTLYPKRTNLAFCLFFLIYQYVLKEYVKKIPIKYYPRIGLLVIGAMVLFHITQVAFHKSIYNNWQSKGEYNHFESTILDTCVYINGNISNTDLYIENSKVDGHFFAFNNTLYPFYSVLSNFVELKHIPMINNYYISSGLFSTNTINFVAYYIDDEGIVYAFVIVLFLFIFMENISKKKSAYAQIVYPFILYCAVLSFRENDFMLIYFYITNILVMIGTFKIKKR